MGLLYILLRFSYDLVMENLNTHIADKILQCELNVSIQFTVV